MRRFGNAGARATSTHTGTGRIRSPERLAGAVAQPIAVTDTTSVGDDRLRRHVVEQSRHLEIVSIRRRYEFASLR
jgi:hypothetical protein